MKKLLFPALIILTVLFSACKDKKTEVEEPFSLVGKTYAAFAYTSSSMNGSQYDVYYVIKFENNSQLERTARMGNIQGKIIGGIETGKYTLNYPKISIKLEDYSKTIEGTFIDEDSFRTGSSSDYSLLEYNKQ